MNKGTPADPLREALQALLDHCAGQGWWLQRHAIKVMDDARAALATKPAEQPGRSSEDWRRLTGIWRYGESVLPHSGFSKDFYVWLALLDARINDRTSHPTERAGKSP